MYTNEAMTTTRFSGCGAARTSVGGDIENGRWGRGADMCPEGERADDAKVVKDGVKSLGDSEEARNVGRRVKMMKKEQPVSVTSALRKESEDLQI